MNVLDHDVVISDIHMGGIGHAYICINCQSEIIKFNSSVEFFIWIDHGYINLLSCSEMIIKKILE